MDEGEEAVRNDGGIVEVVLYLSPGSAASTRARRNLDVALRRYEPARYHLIVRDVSEDLAESEADHIVFTPTLIVRHASAPCTLVGDLADTTALTAMLSLEGLESTG